MISRNRARKESLSTALSSLCTHDDPKVLLLGPGEAGKSTVLKQLKCIYKGGIPLAEQRVSIRGRKAIDTEITKWSGLWCGVLQ